MWHGRDLKRAVMIRESYVTFEEDDVSVLYGEIRKRKSFKIEGEKFWKPQISEGEKI